MAVQEHKYPEGSVGHGYLRVMALRETERRQENVIPFLATATLGQSRQSSSIGDARKPHAVGLRPLVATKVSEREAHRVIKVWRALWKKMAAFGYCNRDADPALCFANPAPEPRQDEWREGEVVRLVKAAWRDGYKGLVRELVSQQTRECWCSYQIIISAGDELPDGEVFRRGNTTTHNEGSVPPEAQKCAAEGTGVSRGGNTYTDLTDLPDQRGGAQARPAPVDLKQKTLDQADRALVIYNSFAEKNRLERCARLTPKRRSWLSKRLNEIGGLENFERALSELPNDDWLMGRVIHNGRSFTLTLDRLLYTGGDVGDRLANLLDAAIEAERSLTARSVAERKLERLPKNT